MTPLFTITSTATAEIWTKAGEVITDTMPILLIFTAVAVGLLIIIGIINIIKK